MSMDIKVYLPLFVCIIYNFYHLFEIINKSILYYWNIKSNDWFISQVNIRGNFWK